MRSLKHTSIAYNQDMDEKELEEMKRKVEELEEEARKLKEMQEQVDMATSAEPNKEEVDARSIFVGNVSPSIYARVIGILTDSMPTG